MRQLEAFAATLELAKSLGLYNTSSDTPAADYEHLADMYQRARDAEPPYSEAKLGRHLGWVQACVYVMSNGETTLDTFKELNKRFAE